MSAEPTTRREQAENAEEAARPLFATTHWSVVLAAGGGSSPSAQAALEELCRIYWYPLYVYVRRRGYSHEDAQDLTQGFLLQFLRHESFARAAPSRGRFRSFLLAGLNHFLSDQRERAQAQKRGGGQCRVPCDFEEAEVRYGLEVADSPSPDRAFERQWALALLEQVLLKLEQQYREAGRDRLFVALKPFLVEGAQSVTYAEVGTGLGVSEEVIKKSVQRLRHRYGRLFREQIAHTLDDPAGVEDELRYLRQVISA